MVFAEFVVGAFAACNAARIVAYVPQILRIVKDPEGAKAVSLGTWGLFAGSNVTTVAYALTIVEDLRMAAVFSVNAAACVTIFCLTVARRRQRASGSDTQGPGLRHPHRGSRRAGADSASPPRQ
ncbi:hypothetical protein [Alsobacter sp. SYSU BS001988]